jgi:protein phosphatase
MQLTIDHNYLLVLDNGLASGRITQEEYDSEYYKGSSLISVLGMDELVRVDINTKPLELVGGDVLILMSDGLYKALDDDEIAQCLSGDAQSCCDELMRRIEKSKLPLDNTTFIVERIITEG